MPRESDDDDEKLYFQMDRFRQANGEWYYTTRDGDEKGPFESKREAEADLATYVREKLRTDLYGD